ncbi:hypothetical protein, partial [Klebsiella oxytoca]|uniref:hypothetical protein n=1 Tax=Klebsiella oxytoca TaxID=571 RepID=UPI001954C965
LYTYSEPHNPVEVVNIESTLFGHIDKPSAPRLTGGGDAPSAVKERRPLIFSAEGTAIEAPIYDGAKLGVDAVVTGPAVIE